MAAFLRNNSLSLALFGLFAVSLAGQAVAGWMALAEELAHHQRPAIGFLAYLVTGHFQSALFENWESEFLQMAAYVLLTAILIQKGSPESKKPDGSDAEDEPVSARAHDPDAPWPVRRGGLVAQLYGRSLTIALLALLALSFWLHLAASTRRANEDALRHGQPLDTIADTIVSPEFWYESFQNWQSEFLSIGLLVVLSIFLRQRGSPESKPVGAPHVKTGR